jgi:O-antigen/teichoic acid export membrane protein
MIRQLAGHTAAYTFANLASRGTVLAWLIILPSFLSASDYGALGLILTAAALVNVIVPLEISQALARYYPAAAPDEQRALVRTAWTFTVAMLVIAASLALLFSRELCGLLLGTGDYLVPFRIAVVFFVLNTAFYFIHSQLRWQFKVRGFTWVTLLFAAVTLVGSIGLAAALPRALEGVLIGQAAGAAAGIVGGLVVLRGGLKLGFLLAKLKQLLRFSAPLVPASVALFISNYASRLILSDMLDLREVGLFTWASQLATVPALLLLGIQGALTPLVMRDQGRGDTPVVLARTFEAIVAMESILCLGLAAFTPEFIALLGYSDFAASATLVMLLAPAFVMLQLYIFSPGFALAERTDLQLLVSVIGAAVAIAANYLLISYFGLFGAALASLIAAAAFIGSWFVLSNRFYSVPIRWSRLSVVVAAAAVAGAAIWAVGNQQGLLAIVMKSALLIVFAGSVALAGLLRYDDWRALLASSSRNIERDTE